MVHTSWASHRSNSNLFTRSWTSQTPFFDSWPYILWSCFRYLWFWTSTLANDGFDWFWRCMGWWSCLCSYIVSRIEMYAFMRSIYDMTTWQHARYQYDGRITTVDDYRMLPQANSNKRWRNKSDVRCMFHSWIGRHLK
jgi:hypothetical protein